MKKFLMAAAGAAALAFAAAPANALIYIGLSEATVSGGAITTVDSDAAIAFFGGTYGNFTLNAVQGVLGTPPMLLNSSSVNTSSTAGGTLDVYITRDNISGPVPTIGFLSGFTTNFLPAGWTVTTRTYVDATNATVNGMGQFTGAFGTQVGLASFTGSADLQTASSFGLAGPGAGPYSVTERYTIVANGVGDANSTISLSVVPEPASWALMIVGFGAAGAMVRSRRKVAVTA